MLKAVIFDIDGVLVDSKEANAAFYRSLLNKAGYGNIDRSDILACFHLPLRQSLEKLIGSDDQSEIQRIFEMAKDTSLRDKTLFRFPEKLEYMLEQLHQKYRLAIVTSRIKIGVDDIFSVKDIEHLFDAVVTFEDYSNPKPHPEPLLVALQMLGLSASEAIYIGDSPTDIEAAQAARIKSVYLSPDEHKHATVRVSEFNMLLDAVEELANQ